MREPGANPPLEQLGRWGLIAGIAAGLLCVLGGWFFPASFFPAYLVGYLFWLGISLGCLAICMLHHLTGGEWGIPIRRILEAGLAPLPLLAILFIPVLFSLPVLYAWARPDEVAHDAVLRHKAMYLNPLWIQIRAAVYFVLWLLLAFVMNRSPVEPSPQRERRLILVSAHGIILWGLTVTFASVDWVMSLTPHWFSSMFGVLFIGAQGVSGLSLVIVIAALCHANRPWTTTVTPDRVHDLGNLLLAFVMFWSYVSFMQFLIIWSGNRPEEAEWYLVRSGGGWQAFAGLLALLHFVVPFLLLLQRQVKRDVRRLAAIALLLLGMRLFDLYWLVIPTFSPGRLTLNPWAIVTPIAVGGLWLWLFARRLIAIAEAPLFDPAPVQGDDADVAEHA